jgi:hypothetical protein
MNAIMELTYPSLLEAVLAERKVSEAIERWQAEAHQPSGFTIFCCMPVK